MKEIYDIILELREDNSSKYKQKVLEKYKKNKTLTKFLFYVYNPRFNYYMTSLPDSEMFRHYTEDLDNESFYGILDKIRNREITGDKAKEEFAEHLSFCGANLYNLYSLIIERDIKSNVSIKTINKVFPNLIPEVPYMRCSNVVDYKQENFFKDSTAFAQKKSDGVFNYIIKENDKVTLLTRNGTEWYSEALNKNLSWFPNNRVLVGEALIKYSDRELDRKTGNGLITKFIKRFDTLDTLEKKFVEAKTEVSKSLIMTKIAESLNSYEAIDNALHFEVWDCLTKAEFDYGYSGIGYEDRLNILEIELSLNPNKESSKVSLTETFVVSIFEEAQLIANNYIANGYEGAILKARDLPFENKTSKQQIKLKSIKDCDLVCVGYEKGKGKYEGMIGALICESSCGNLKVNIGSGLNDADRSVDFKEYQGKIITVKYNERTKNKNSETYSLFLPRFVEIRIDKDRADTLEDIL